jgi:parvulin-like peptidyl-prolyl isomerase
VKKMREEANPQFVLKYGTSDLDVIRVVEEEARILSPGKVGPNPNGTDGTVIPAATGPSDNSTRIVAYIYGNIPITREDLGVFLIDRYGQKKLEIMVNRKIIEYTCRQHNITVTPEEVQADIADTQLQLGIDKTTFIKKYLKDLNLTLIEWQEDVVKPRIMLSKLCQNQVRVDDADIQRAFDILYGEAVKTRLILWPKGTERQAHKMYDEIRSSEAAFDNAARHQASPKLSAVGGFLDPIRHGHDDAIERIAFKLKLGEVSELFEIPGQGIAVLRCEGRQPPDPTKKLETENENLRKMAFDQKMAKMIPEVVNKMRADANPKFELRYGTNDQDVIRAAEEEFKMSNQPLPGGDSPVVPLPK